jgi:hypothetical protein
MNGKSCKGCGELFQIRAQNPNQTHCSKKSCQSERRRLWQRNKLKTDPDYRENQRNAQQAWQERNKQYWQKYREEHPSYAEQNRISQRRRNNKQNVEAIAKMNMSIPVQFPCSGTYQLIPKRQKKLQRWTCG